MKNVTGMVDIKEKFVQFGVWSCRLLRIYFHHGVDILYMNHNRCCVFSKETLQVSDNKKRKRVGTRPLEEFENNNAPTVFMNVGKNKRSQSQYAFDQKDIPTVSRAFPCIWGISYTFCLNNIHGDISLLKWR